MGYRSINIKLAQPDEWDDLLENFPQHTVFHRRSWLETVEEEKKLGNSKLKLISVGNENSVIAVWPFFLARKGPIRVIGSPFPGTSTPYLGPLFSEGTDPSKTMRLIHQDGVIRGSFHACRTLDQPEPINIENLGYKKVRRFKTYIIDLRQDESLLWSRLKSECRNRIRKAKKSNIEIRREHGIGFLNDFWPMALDVFAKARRQPSYTRQFLDLICHRLESDGRLLVLTAFLSQKRIGSLILPYDSHTMYYWAGASDAQYNRYAPNNLLHWEAILEARKLGLKRYDFVSTKGSRGDFKRKFGPEAFEVCTHWERTSSPIVHMAKKAYEHWIRKRQVAL